MGNGYLSAEEFEKRLRSVFVCNGEDCNTQKFIDSKQFKEEPLMVALKSWRKIDEYQLKIIAQKLSGFNGGFVSNKLLDQLKQANVFDFPKSNKF